MLAEAAAAAAAAASPMGAMDSSLEAAAVAASSLQCSADDLAADKTATPSPTGTSPYSHSISNEAKSGPPSPSSHPPASGAAGNPLVLPCTTSIYGPLTDDTSGNQRQQQATSSAPPAPKVLVNLPYCPQPAWGSQGTPAAVVSAAPVWHQQDLQLLQGGPQQEQQIQLPTANSTLAWPSGTPAAAAVETMAAQLRTTQALLSSTMALTDVSQAAEGGTAGRAPRDMLTRVQQQQQQQQLQAESDYAVFLDELLQLSAEVENAKQPPTMHPMLSVAEGT